VGVQEVRWEKSGTQQAKDYTLLYKEGNEDHQLGTGFLAHKRIIIAVRRAEILTGWTFCIIISSHWCNIILLTVHAPCEDKSDEAKDSFYEVL
jgi:hypothetical protein